MVAQDSTSDRGDRAFLLRRMLEEHGRISEELYAPDAVNHQPWDLAAQTLGGLPSPGDGEAEGLNFKSMFSETEVTIEDAVEEGEDVVVRWRLRGIHSREVFGIKPTNAAVNTTGQTTYRFADDKIVESWGAVDCSSLGDLCSQVVMALIGVQGIDQAHLREIITPDSPTAQSL